MFDAEAAPYAIWHPVPRMTMSCATAVFSASVLAAEYVFLMLFQSILVPLATASILMLLPPLVNE